MHSSRSAVSTGSQQHLSPRATRISFPPTPRFSLPDSTVSPCNRSNDQKANLMHAWDEARDALNILPFSPASDRERKITPGVF